MREKENQHVETREDSRNEKDFIQVVIDTPKSSRNKLKFDPESKSCALSKILPEGMVFPYDFGFVPSTNGQDGDPVDVLVLIEEPTFPGCRVECRLIGVIEAEQSKEKEKVEPVRNDRLIGVARASLLYAEMTDIAQVPQPVLGDIEGFFVNYDRLRGVDFKVLSRSGPDRANEILASARRSPDRGAQRE
ncbi:MAG: inorganic diphosphatase [Candidatus Acidiferrales bacterium]